MVYQRAAALVGAAEDEIAIVDSASTGLRVIIDALRLGPRDTIVVSRSAYVSHALHLMTIAAERRVGLEVVDTTGDGCMDLDMLDDVLGRVPNPVVCPAHIPTSSGLVEPAVVIGRLAEAHGARFILDATQSVGHLPVNVDEIGCDALVTTGRKFLRAPRGTAFLYVRRRLLESLAPAAPDVRGSTWTGDRTWTVDDSARRFEVWESFVAGRLGLGIALDQAIERGVPPTAAYIIWLSSLARERLGAIDGVIVADPPAAASGIVTFVVERFAPPRVVEELAASGVRVVSIPAAHARWDLAARGHDAVVRASFHVYNDVADIDALAVAVEQIVAGRMASRS
jgi:selenocysteine lyase/cysteine desulfurase